MATLGVNLAIEFGVSLSTFLLGFASNRYALPFVQRRFNVLRELTRFDGREGIDLCYGIIPPGTSGRSSVAEEGDLAAIYVIADVFKRLFTSEQVRIHNARAVAGTLDSFPNIVSISGPKWNRVTERLIGELGSSVIFDRNSRCMLQSRGGEIVAKYTTDRTQPFLARKCHGLILCGYIERSDGSTQKAMVCAGNSTLSMYGIATYLLNLSRTPGRKADAGLKQFTKMRKWGLVVEVANKVPQDRDGLVWLPLDPTTIHTSVVAQIPEGGFVRPFVYEY